MLALATKEGGVAAAAVQDTRAYPDDAAPVRVATVLIKMRLDPMPTSEATDRTRDGQDCAAEKPRFFERSRLGLEVSPLESSNAEQEAGRVERKKVGVIFRHLPPGDVDLEDVEPRGHMRGDEPRLKAF